MRSFRHTSNQLFLSVLAATLGLYQFSPVAYADTVVKLSKGKEIQRINEVLV